VNDVRSPVLNDAAPDLRGDEREGGEALPVVRIVLAVLVGIGATRPVKEAGRIEDEELQPRFTSRKERRALAEKVIIARNRRSVSVTDR
jgi:hypothetical protein